MLHQRRYFNAVIVAYLLGLGMAFGVRPPPLEPACVAPASLAPLPCRIAAPPPAPAALRLASLPPPRPPCPQVNALTHMGQPALLYLCPMTLSAVALTAARRGDLGRIWSFTDTTAASSQERKRQLEQAQQRAKSAQWVAERQEQQRRYGSSERQPVAGSAAAPCPPHCVRFTCRGKRWTHWQRFGTAGGGPSW